MSVFNFYVSFFISNYPQYCVCVLALNIYGSWLDGVELLYLLAQQKHRAHVVATLITTTPSEKDKAAALLWRQWKEKAISVFFLFSSQLERYTIYIYNISRGSGNIYTFCVFVFSESKSH